MTEDALRIAKIVIKKLGTLLVDRRLIFYLASVLLVLFGVPNAADQATALDKQVQDLIVLIGQIIVIVSGMVTTVSSWTKRPPSGLQYDTIVSDQTQLYKIKALLEDLGVQID